MRNSGLGVISIALDPAKRASWSPVPIRLFRAVAWLRDSSSDSDKLVAKNRISQRKQWTSEACKSAGLRLRSFEPYLSHHYKRLAPLALVLWCRGSDQTVARPSDHAGDKGRILPRRDRPQTVATTELEHDPEKWNPVSEKIMLKQKARAGCRSNRNSSALRTTSPSARSSTYFTSRYSFVQAPSAGRRTRQECPRPARMYNQGLRSHSAGRVAESILRTIWQCRRVASGPRPVAMACVSVTCISMPRVAHICCCSRVCADRYCGCRD